MVEGTGRGAQIQTSLGMDIVGRNRERGLDLLDSILLSR